MTDGSRKVKKKASAKLVRLRTPEARVSALGIARETAKDIERGVYQPGEKLREQELADRFKCSRAPVREALRILESQGSVVIEPMRGARIASIEDHSFREVYLIRRALAGMMAQEAAQAPNNAAKLAFVASARALARAATGDATSSSYGFEVRKTIRSFITLAQTPRTVQLVRSLTFGHEAFQADIFETEKSRVADSKFWGKLGDAVEAGDPNRARAAIEKIFDHAFAYVEANFGSATRKQAG